MRILLVEDDKDLAEGLAEALVTECYAVDRAATGAEADQCVADTDYDLVVLDWRIPPPSGLELLASWRKAGLGMPVLMLTGRASIEDRVAGLDTGADDYLAKPFALGEFLARVRSLLRRRQHPVQMLAAADVEMNRGAHLVRVAGEPLHLTPKEFGVLEYLLMHRDHVVRRSELLEHVWEDGLEESSNTLEVIVSRLRKKLDGTASGRLIHTVSGVGYLLSSERHPAGWGPDP